MKLAIEESDIAVVWHFFAKTVDLKIYIYWIFMNNDTNNLLDIQE